MSAKKRKLYEALLSRQVHAFEAGYYYETCWFAHAVFEDRTRSITANSGDGTGYGGTISEKLALITQRIDKRVTKVVGGKAVKNRKTGKKEKVPKWPHLQTIDRKLIDDIKEALKNLGIGP